MKRTEQQMKREFRQWINSTRFRPIAGADGDGDDPKDGDDPEKEGAGDPKEGDDPKDGDDPEKEEKDDPAKGDDAVAQLQGQVKELTDKLAKAEQAAAKAKKEANEAKAANAEKAGDFKNLATQRETELTEVTEERDKATEERDSAKADLDNYQRTVRVTSIAVRLGFKDPADAMSLLASEKNEDDVTGDDATAERTLRKLAEKKPYLVDAKKATGRPTSGSNGSSGLSMDEIRNMSQDQVAANLDAVHKALAKP